MLCRCADVHNKNIKIIDPNRPARNPFRIDPDLKEAVLFILNLYSYFKSYFSITFYIERTNWIATDSELIV